MESSFLYLTILIYYTNIKPVHHMHIIMADVTRQEFCGRYCKHLHGHLLLYTRHHINTRGDKHVTKAVRFTILVHNMPTYQWNIIKLFQKVLELWRAQNFTFIRGDNQVTKAVHVSMLACLFLYCQNQNLITKTWDKCSTSFKQAVGSNFF